MSDKKIKTVKDMDLPDPPEITPEIIKQLDEEGQSLSKAFMERTKKMILPGDPVIDTIDAALRKLTDRVGKIEDTLDRLAQHIEGRLHTVREHMKTVRVQGKRICGDEELDTAYGEAFKK